MSGRALVLVDGLDEVRDGAAFQRSVERFVAAFPSCPVVATSRPAGCEAIAGFTSATLTPMTRDEVTTFVDRWCKSAELSVQSDAESAVLAAERAAEDLKGRIRSSRPVERLAENPLMCGVICIVHRFLGERIPERRAALYEACTNVLLYEWDRAKFPAGAAIGALDAQDKRFLLGELALLMHERKVAEIAEEDVCAAIERRLPELKGAVANSRTRATEIIAEIRDRSGLLVERSPGKFGFSHLSFQEYLAATELVRERKTAVLVSHAKEEWWGEVIVLAAGLPGADAQELIRGLLRADRSAPKVGIDRALILAALCLDSAVSVPVALRREVEGRISPFVPPRSAKGVERLEPFGELLVPLLLRAFDGVDAQAKAYTAILLRVLHAEAGIVKIATMLPGPFSAAAIITLARWARDSALAQRTLLATIRERTSVLEETRHLSKGSNDIAAILALHDAATKAPPSPPPKRAARTG